MRLQSYKIAWKIHTYNQFISSREKLTIQEFHLSLNLQLLRLNKTKTGFTISKPMATKQRLLIFDFRPCLLRRFKNILNNGVNFEKSGLFNVQIQF